MGLTLNLGVLDIAYSDASGGATTTGKVADILETNYSVMGTFFALRKEKIAGYLANSMAQSIENFVKRGRRIDPSLSWTFSADQKIEAAFRRFLNAGEMDTLNFALTGTAFLSAAAARGVNHRRKHPYAKANRPRPSFIDTGLYRSSFRAWTVTQIAQSEGYALYG